MHNAGYADFPWKGRAGRRWKTRKAASLHVEIDRELDIYLKRHGLTTIGRKDDKVKAIRCHFFRQTTNPTTDENESDESDTSDGETETESESEDEESDDDVVLADLDLNSINNIQFVPDELVSLVHQAT